MTCCIDRILNVSRNKTILKRKKEPNGKGTSFFVGNMNGESISYFRFNLSKTQQIPSETFFFGRAAILSYLFYQIIANKIYPDNKIKASKY